MQHRRRFDPRPWAAGLLAALIAACAPVAGNDAAPTAVPESGGDDGVPPGFREASFAGGVLARIGPAIEPGTWLRTHYVEQIGPGYIVDEETGRIVAVTLVPIPGPVSRDAEISVDALAALGIDAPRLVVLSVFVRGQVPARSEEAA
ncbi:MAG: hypothetical protein AAGE18_06375 [Pseudomonadota bacterium]